MPRIFGIAVGLAWFGLAFMALQKSLAGWSADQGDVGFWWAVITAFLSIAAVGALVGTWIHTGTPRER